MVLVLFVLAWLGCSSGSDPVPPPRPPTPAFDRYRRPELLVAALGLQAGQRVVDLGAGRGYLSPLLAAAVGPTGRVVATDVDATALAELRSRVVSAAAVGSAQVATRLVTADDPGLAQERYDLILMSEVDHLLADRVAYLARLRLHLAPGGRLAVSNRRPYRQAVLDAAAAAGFVLQHDERRLPAHFLLIFGVKS